MVSLPQPTPKGEGADSSCSGGSEEAPLSKLTSSCIGESPQFQIYPIGPLPKDEYLDKLWHELFPLPVGEGHFAALNEGTLHDRGAKGRRYHHLT
jgi:hypothetical protein